MATDVITILQPGSSAPGSIPSVSPVADPTNQAMRTSLRPMEYFNGGQVLGHYRAISLSGAVASISANGILAHLWWNDASDRRCIVTRLGVSVAVMSTVTTATPLDVKATILRGGTAAGSGTNSTTLAATAPNANKMKTGMEKSLLLTNGEIRTIATTTALTGPTNSTLDTNPFAFVTFPSLITTNATGTTVSLYIGTNWPMTDLYKATEYNHPLELSSGEGVSLALVTAGNGSGTLQYGFLWEWMEVGPSIL